MPTATIPSERTEPGRSLLTPARRAALTCLVVFCLGLAAFLPGLGMPPSRYFDEVHYVPAAQELLTLPPGKRPTLNLEHPPLGKELIALGIALCGDTPTGWRVPSATFGALALVALYLWALALFRDPAPARWATAVTLADQFLYVQARIAMLDIFMAAFTLGALAAWTASWRPGAPVRRLMLATGLLLGLATACKWTGVLIIALWAAVTAIVALFRHWRVRFDQPRDTDWFRPDLWQGMQPGDWIIALLIAPLAVYALTFLPITGPSIPDFLHAQAEMWRLQSTVAIASHPYASSWHSWPFLLRPIWYLFEPAPDGASMAVVFLGNPIVLWLGIPALLTCFVAFIRFRRFDAFLLCACYASLYLAWAVIPRHLGFLFYYFPAGLVLGPALAFMFYQTPLARLVTLRWLYLAAAFAGFAYFLPISSAAMTVTLPAYNQLMWFPSWR